MPAGKKDTTPPQNCLLHFGIWALEVPPAHSGSILGKVCQYTLESGDIHGQRAVLASYQRSLKAEGLESFLSVRPRKEAAERVVSGKFAVFLGRDLHCKVARLALS